MCGHDDADAQRRQDTHSKRDIQITDTEKTTTNVTSLPEERTGANGINTVSRGNSLAQGLDAVPCTPKATKKTGITSAHTSSKNKPDLADTAAPHRTLGVRTRTKQGAGRKSPSVHVHVGKQKWYFETSVHEWMCWSDIILSVKQALGPSQTYYLFSDGISLKTTQTQTMGNVANNREIIHVTAETENCFGMDVKIRVRKYLRQLWNHKATVLLKTTKHFKTRSWSYSLRSPRPKRIPGSWQLTLHSWKR